MSLELYVKYDSVENTAISSSFMVFRNIDVHGEPHLDVLFFSFQQSLVWPAVNDILEKCELAFVYFSYTNDFLDGMLSCNK